MQLKAIAKLVVSLLMLGLVLMEVDFAQLRDTIHSLPTWVPIVTVVGYTLGQCLSAFKWFMLARSGGLRVRYLDALKASFIGMFVNAFGLGLVGGDLVRGLMLGTWGNSKTSAFATVAADRLHGLAVLAGIGIVSTLAFGNFDLGPWFFPFLAFFLISISAGWIFGPRLLVELIPMQSRFRSKAEIIAKAFPTHPGKMAIVTLLSILFHLVQISLHGVIALGFGISNPWSRVLQGVPFVNIVANLPISWMGLGVREQAYLHFLSPQLFNHEQAVACGALWLLGVTVTSAVGGIVAWVSGDLKSLRQRAASSAAEAETPVAVNQSQI